MNSRQRGNMIVLTTKLGSSDNFVKNDDASSQYNFMNEKRPSTHAILIAYMSSTIELKYSVHRSMTPYFMPHYCICDRHFWWKVLMLFMFYWHWRLIKEREKEVCERERERTHIKQALCMYALWKCVIERIYFIVSCESSSKQGQSIDEPKSIFVSICCFNIVLTGTSICGVLFFFWLYHHNTSKNPESLNLYRIKKKYMYD